MVRQCLVDIGRYVPPVTKMTFPSRLPISLDGSKDFPMLMRFVFSQDAGMTKLYLYNSSANRWSAIWHKI